MEKMAMEQNEGQNNEEQTKEEQTVEIASNSDNAIQEIIERAITDNDFKESLLENPDEVLDQYDISEISRIMIKSLTREDYEKLTPENITEYFSADSAIYTPDFDESIAIDYAGEDDI